MQNGYMGVLVAETPEHKACFTCEHELRVDRAECNACARQWQASNMTQYIGWKAK